MNKASAYRVVDGRVTGEMRQCSHCQFSWEYKQGSGKKRGVCLKCMGLVCGASKCLAGCAPIREIIRGGDMSYEMKNGVMVKR